MLLRRSLLPLLAAAAAVSAWSEADETHAHDLLQKYPLIDTHLDLPQVLRVMNRRPFDEIPKLAGSYPGHVDIPRMRAGGVGGAFLTAWAPCLDASETGKDFLKPTELVRDTLESLDLIHEMIAQYPEDFAYVTSSDQVAPAFKDGKMAIFIGMEGTHMLGNSLGVLRMYHRLGIRYLTLTHVCSTSFASSNGGGVGTDGSRLKPIHPGNGLTDLGRTLIGELNRLGIMVDLSHVTDETAVQAIALSRAPVVWTHSGSREVFDHPRNVPDDVLRLIGNGPGQNRGIVHSIMVDAFIDPNNATIAKVVDHIEHVASVVGRAHVGLGSDFDGMSGAVIGLDGADKWPSLVAELISRGWTDGEIEGIAGANLLRVMAEVERVADELKHEAAAPDIYEQRTDLPSFSWAGPHLAYVPPDIQAVVRKLRVRDEL